MKWISSSYIKPFYSDKKLILLLVNLIKYIHSNEILTLNIEDDLIKIEFYLNYNISEYYIS